PSKVHWMGKGLDTAKQLSDAYEMPFMRTKNQLQDYILGKNLLADNQLYQINNNLSIEPSDDDDTRHLIESKLDSFRQVNQYVTHQNRLMRHEPGRNATPDNNLQFSADEVKTLNSLCNG